MEDVLKKVVEHIFNNWSALQLAVEHSMGGPNSNQIAVSTVDYMVNYLISENGIEVEDVEDVLEDIMEQELNTVCEDNSIKEVATLLIKFLCLIQDNKMQEVELEYNKLPPSSQWLSRAHCVMSPNQQETGECCSSSQCESDTPMQDAPMEEVEDGWTQVKTKKRH